jgi:hypothetical protein
MRMDLASAMGLLFTLLSLLRSADLNKLSANHNSTALKG